MRWPTLFNRRKRRRTIYMRNFAGAEQDRLTADWTARLESPDQQLERDLQKLRARSRERAHNDDYAKRYVRLSQNNVVGSEGIKLQVKARRENGELDKNDNDVIERHWRMFAKRGMCEITGRHSWISALNLLVRTLVVDGECFIRHVTSSQLPYGYQFQFLNTDLLDEQYNETLKTGRIRMGVELDSMDRAVAYHFFTSHPTEHYLRGGRKYVRVPAGQIMHIYMQDSIDQHRGIPWTASSLFRMRMVNGYEISEMTAARVAAAKMGFYTQGEDGAEYEGEEDSATDSLISKAEPGTFEKLPYGVQMQMFDPTHPTTAFGSFMKSVLRGMASGLNISYNALSNDLEGVNYSSIRSGVLEDREAWKAMQRLIIESFCIPVYERWLSSALLINALDGLPSFQYDKFNAPKFQGRRWPWVDPLKDQQAAKEGISAALTTISETIRESGRDPDEVFEELAQDYAKLRELGVPIETGVNNGEEAEIGTA